MKQIALTNLSVAETNTIIKALGNMPYVQVCELIAKIHSQATEQTKPEENKTDEKK